jgi:hypothetical protein
MTIRAGFAKAAGGDACRALAQKSDTIVVLLVVVPLAAILSVARAMRTIPGSADLPGISRGSVSEGRRRLRAWMLVCVRSMIESSVESRRHCG